MGTRLLSLPSVIFDQLLLIISCRHFNAVRRYFDTAAMRKFSNLFAQLALSRTIDAELFHFGIERRAF